MDDFQVLIEALTPIMAPALLRLDVQPPAPIRRQPTPREQQQES